MMENLGRLTALSIAILFIGTSINLCNIPGNKTQDIGMNHPNLKNDPTLSGDNWWSSSWSYRKQITVNHVDVAGNLANFPVLVSTVMNPNKVQADGGDIVFTDSQGTKLNHEIEIYDNITGTLVAWVNVTSVSSSADTILYMYYGNPSCDNQQNKYGTWDSHYKAVYHMSGADASAITDSTSNNNNAIGSSGTITYQTPGTAGYCVYFHNGMLTFNSPVQNSFPMTVETWAYPTVISSWGNWYIDNGPRNGNVGMQLDIDGENNNVIFYQFMSEDSSVAINVGPRCSENNWYNIVIKWDGSSSDQSICQDNTAMFYSPATYPPRSGSSNLVIGDFMGWVYDFTGCLDEIRFSDIVRNNSWINTTYNSMIYTSFLTIGEEQHPRLFTLNITIQGLGTITKDPDLQTYINGTIVNLTASPSTGWQFNHWGGDLTGNQNPTTVTMNGNKSVVANFSAIHYTLAITIEGQGNVTKNPDQPWYTYGQIVTLTATGSTHWDFNHWNGDLSGNTNPTTIITNENKSVTANFTFLNNPPVTPFINGPTSGKIRKSYNYSFAAEDPENDSIFYQISWGDGTNEDWLGPFESNALITRNHTWKEKGTYTIAIRAKDIYGAIGPWGTLIVTKPLAYEPTHHPILRWLLERFPHAFPILRQLLGY